MAKKRFNSKFYNIDFVSLERISRVPKDTRILCKVVGEATDEKVDKLIEMFGDYMHGIQKIGEPNAWQWLSQQIVVTVDELEATKAALKEMGLHLSYDKYTYIKHKTDDGTLYAGWKTGRRTKIKPEDLPETYVRCNNYKKNGYIETAGVVDIHYKPSPFHNHTYKDDFIFISYSKTMDPDTEMWDQCDEYIFGGDIVDVIFGIEKNAPELKEKIQAIKDAMVVQYNLYVDEMSQWPHNTTTKIEKLEDIRV